MIDETRRSPTQDHEARARHLAQLLRTGRLEAKRVAIAAALGDISAGFVIEADTNLPPIQADSPEALEALEVIEDAESQEDSSVYERRIAYCLRNLRPREQLIFALDCLLRVAASPEVPPGVAQVIELARRIVDGASPPSRRSTRPLMRDLTDRQLELHDLVSPDFEDKVVAERFFTVCAAVSLLDSLNTEAPDKRTLLLAESVGCVSVGARDVGSELRRQSRRLCELLLSQIEE